MLYIRQEWEIRLKIEGLKALYHSPCQYTQANENQFGHEKFNRNH